MPKVRDRVTRQHLPAGLDGEALVLDSRNPTGLRWQPGIDRLITDLTPELSGDLDANDHSITGLDTLTFTDTAGTIAGVQNQNLLDKSAGVYGVAGLITGSGTASTGAMTATTWTPVPSGGTHVLASDSSSVFELEDFGVMKYVGVPTIVVEFTCTGSIVKLATAGTQAVFIGVGKRNAAAPVAASIQINLTFLSVTAIGEHHPFAITWITQLATNDHIAPMFLAFFSTPTLGLAQFQTHVRSIREV